MKELLYNVLKYSISNIANFVLSFLAVIILTRAFQPEQYGFINIFNSTVALMLSVVYLGLDSAFIRFYNEPPESDKRQFSIKLIIISLLSDIIITLILFVLRGDQRAELTFGVTNKYIWLFVGIAVSAQLILRYLNIIYRMSFKSKQYNIQAVLVTLISKVFMILAALLGKGYVEMLFINVIGVVILSFVYIWIQRKAIIPDKWNCNFSNYGPIFKFAAFSMPLAIGINLNNYLSQQIIVKNMGTYYVGIYSSAGYFSSILSALQGGFTTFWSAFMYSHYKNEQFTIKRVHDYVIIFCIIMMAMFVCFRDVIYLFIGKDYYESKAFFSVVLIYPMLCLISETTVYGIAIEKKNYYTLLSYAVSIVLNLILSIIWTPNYGLVGTACASAVSGIVFLTVGTVIGQRLYSSMLDKWRSVRGVVLLLMISAFDTLFESKLTYLLVLAVVFLTLINYKDNVQEVITLMHNRMRNCNKK